MIFEVLKIARIHIRIARFSNVDMRRAIRALLTINHKYIEGFRPIGKR